MSRANVGPTKRRRAIQDTAINYGQAPAPGKITKVPRRARALLAKRPNGFARAVGQPVSGSAQKQSTLAQEFEQFMGFPPPMPGGVVPFVPPSVVMQSMPGAHKQQPITPSAVRTSAPVVRRRTQAKVTTDKSKHGGKIIKYYPSKRSMLIRIKEDNGQYRIVMSARPSQEILMYQGVEFGEIKKYEQYRAVIHEMMHYKKDKQMVQVPFAWCITSLKPFKINTDKSGKIVSVEAVTPFKPYVDTCNRYLYVHANINHRVFKPKSKAQEVVALASTVRLGAKRPVKAPAKSPLDRHDVGWNLGGLLGGPKPGS